MELAKLWKSVLSEVELSVSKATFGTHFANSELLSLESGVATVGLPNPMMRTMVETRYYSLIKSIIDHHTGENVSLVFSIIPRKHAMSAADAGPLFSEAIAPPVVNTTTIAKKLHLRPENTFESFAVSTSNQIAYAAATAVAKSPGTAYNPLFFYGGVGVGKTHLMHAVANSMLARKSSTKVVYCMGEEFLNEIIEAIQTKTVRQFKAKYRSADLLLVDDVQFIAGKQTAQEEFFHTFNTVHREGGQIILTSDRPPEEIARLEDRLRSRFEGGLIVDISPPDFELRAAIINIKSQALGLSLSPDSVQIIAANLTDTRAIEGFLKRLLTEASTRRSDIGPELVTQIISAKRPVVTDVATIVRGGGTERQSKRVSPQDVLEAVSSFFDMKTTALKGPKRDRPIARARQLVMYFCKTELGVTLEDIGGMLGGRDHTTVMHGIDTITKELSTNAHLREAVSGIKKQLWGES